MTNNDSRPPFDEAAALAELERVQRAIQSTRRQRAKAVAEFESFLLDAGDSQPVGSPAAPAAPGSKPDVSAPKGTSNIPSPGSVLRGATPSLAKELNARNVTFAPGAPAPSKLAAVTRVLTALKDSAWRQSVRWDSVSASTIRRFGIGSLAAILGLSVLLFARTRSTRAPDNRAADPSSSAHTVPRVNSPATARPAPLEPRALQIEVTTLRPVWLRVTVDGERVVERQVAAAERIQFGAERTIVLRAGDAGALRVKVDGRDIGVFGDAGETMTRTFTAQPKSGRGPGRPRS